MRSSSAARIVEALASDVASGVEAGSVAAHATTCAIAGVARLVSAIVFYPVAIATVTPTVAIGATVWRGIGGATRRFKRAEEIRRRLEGAAASAVYGLNAGMALDQMAQEVNDETAIALKMASLRISAFRFRRPEDALPDMFILEDCVLHGCEVEVSEGTSYPEKPEKPARKRRARKTKAV